MSMEEQIAALVTAVNDNRASTDAKIDALQASMETWKPVILDLQGQVEHLRVLVDKLSTPTAPSPSAAEGSKVVTDPAGSSSCADDEHHGPHGHRQIVTIGGSQPVLTRPGLPPPVTGATSNPNLSLCILSWAMRVRAEHHAVGCFLRWISLRLMARILCIGALVVRNTLMCLVFNLRCGFALRLCTSLTTQHVGFRFKSP